MLCRMISQFTENQYIFIHVWKPLFIFIKLYTYNKFLYMFEFMNVSLWLKNAYIQNSIPQSTGLGYKIHNYKSRLLEYFGVYSWIKYFNFTFRIFTLLKNTNSSP